MRKDYIPSNSNEDELDFVENYWSKVWTNLGGPKAVLDKIPSTDEYKLIRHYLKPASKILDGGCGLGDWVLALSSEGFDVTGVDISRSTISQLNTIFPESCFLFGDIRSLPFPDDVYDVYMSLGVFEHFESGPQACLLEAYRLIKPGGLLFISVPHDNLRHSLLNLFVHSARPSQQYRFYQYRFTRNDLVLQVQLAGFKFLKAKAIHKRQGLLRCLHHEFGLPYNWIVTRALAYILSPLIPGWLISHMILVVAQKPES